MALGLAIAGLSAIAGIYGAKKSADASKSAASSAANAQVQSNRDSIDFQKWVLEQQQAQNRPWQELGADAVTQLRSGIQNGTFQIGSDPGAFQFNRQEPNALKFDLSGVGQDPGAFQFDQSGLGNAPGAFQFDQSQVQMDPGYEFRLQQGLQAQDRTAAARGRLLAPAQAKALERYAQGLASQEYNNAFNRAYQTQADTYNTGVSAYDKNYNRAYQQQSGNYDTSVAANQRQYDRALQQQAAEYDAAINQYNNAFNRDLTQYNTAVDTTNRNYNVLAGLAGAGQVANQQTGQALTNAGSNISGALINQGNALAQGAINAGNARASQYGNTATAINQGLENYLLYDYLNNPQSRTRSLGASTYYDGMLA